MIESFLKGYPIVFIEGHWIFKDTRKSTIITYLNRPCAHCDKLDTIDGHDGCLGILPGVMNACCGHGQIKTAYVQFLDGVTIHGKSAIIILNELKKYNHYI